MKWLLVSLAFVMLIAGLCPLIDAQVICGPYGCFSAGAGFAAPSYPSSSYPMNGGYMTPTYSPATYGVVSGPNGNYPMQYGQFLQNGPSVVAGYPQEFRAYGSTVSYSADGSCSGSRESYGEVWKDPNCSGSYAITPVYSPPVTSAPAAPRAVYGYQKTKITPGKVRTVQRTY